MFGFSQRLWVGAVGHLWLVHHLLYVVPQRSHHLHLHVWATAESVFSVPANQQTSSGNNKGHVQLMRPELPAGMAGLTAQLVDPFTHHLQSSNGMKWQNLPRF